MILPDNKELEEIVKNLSCQLASDEEKNLLYKMNMVFEIVKKYAKLNSAKALNSEYEATPKSCRTCINKCSLITQQGCKNNNRFMWEEA